MPCDLATTGPRKRNVHSCVMHTILGQLRIGISLVLFLFGLTTLGMSQDWGITSVLEQGNTRVDGQVWTKTYSKNYPAPLQRLNHVAPQNIGHKVSLTYLYTNPDGSKSFYTDV